MFGEDFGLVIVGRDIFFLLCYFCIILLNKIVLEGFCLVVVKGFVFFDFNGFIYVVFGFMDFCFIFRGDLIVEEFKLKVDFFLLCYFWIILLKF